MKVFRLSMLHRSTEFNSTDIDQAYDWVKAQMTAADLANCDEVTAKRSFGPTEIHVSLMTTPDPPAPAPPPPEPEPEPEPEPTTTDTTETTDPEADTVIE